MKKHSVSAVIILLISVLGSGYASIDNDDKQHSMRLGSIVEPGHETMAHVTQNTPITQAQREADASHLYQAFLRLMVENDPEHKSKFLSDDIRLFARQEYSSTEELYHVAFVDPDILKDDKGQTISKKSDPFGYKRMKALNAPVLAKTKEDILKIPTSNLTAWVSIDLKKRYDMDKSAFIDLDKHFHLGRFEVSLNHLPRGTYLSPHTIDVKDKPAVSTLKISDAHAESYFDQLSKRNNSEYSNYSLNRTWVKLTLSLQTSASQKDRRGIRIPYAQITAMTFYLPDDATPFASLSNF